MEAKKDKLHHEKHALKQEMSKTQHYLSNLKKIDDNVDKTTLFDNVPIRGSKFSVMVATVYEALLAPNLKPSSHYCYISLDFDSSRERNLFINRGFRQHPYQHSNLA